MIFAGQLDDMRKRALIAFSALPASHMTVPGTEYEVDEPREYTTTSFASFAQDIYKPTSGSWLVTCAFGWLKGVGDRAPVVSNVSSGFQVAERFRTLQTAFEPNAVKEDAAALMVLFGAIGFLASESLSSVGWRGWTGRRKSGETSLLIPVVSQDGAHGPSAQHRERKSIPPTTARRGSPGRGAMRPFAEWFRTHRHAYQGKWVALDERGQFVDSDASRFVLQRRLREAGRLRGAAITLVPDESR